MHVSTYWGGSTSSPSSSTLQIIHVSKLLDIRVSEIITMQLNHNVQIFWALTTVVKNASFKAISVFNHYLLHLGVVI